MATVYACTHVEKRAQVDSYESGCDPTTTVCVMNERCNIQSPTLPGLIKAIGDNFYISMDDVWIADDDENGDIDRIGFNRLEDVDGSEPDANERAKWEKGELVLYLADYDFSIEKREVVPVRLEEFTANNIKFHQ
jgi:hypothetical protein